MRRFETGIADTPFIYVNADQNCFLMRDRGKKGVLVVHMHPELVKQFVANHGMKELHAYLMSLKGCENQP